MKFRNRVSSSSSKAYPEGELEKASSEAPISFFPSVV